MLSGLSSSIKCSRNLGAAKTSVSQQSAVFTRKGDTLGHALIDDAIADLCKAIDICLSGSEIASFYGVIKQAPYAVTFIGVVLGSVNSPLGSDAVRPPGAVLETECFYIIAQLGK